MFKTRVLKVNIPYKDKINDMEFWADTKELKLTSNFTFARLKLTQAIDTDLLTLSNLLENGLNAAPQGPQSIPEQLEIYIKSVFEQAVFPEELNSFQVLTYSEGAKKQIIVNSYERNPVARRKCLQIHGSKCVICNLDFGELYGIEFMGKIHVHHIKPLHLVDNEYEIDPEQDLVPVCPNCHMILHSKQDGMFSVEEVKQMIHRNKEC